MFLCLFMFLSIFYILFCRTNSNFTTNPEYLNQQKEMLLGELTHVIDSNVREGKILSETGIPELKEEENNKTRR